MVADANGDGTFTLVGPFNNVPAHGSLDCVFADFDGNGATDAACANFFANTVSTALNPGGGVFSPATPHPVSDCLAEIDSGDLNGDQIQDLVVTHSDCTQPDIVSIMTGRGDGSFDAPFLLFADSDRALAVGDLDGDGLDDLVLSSGTRFSGPDTIDVHYNISGPIQGSPGDLDGDGDVDLDDLTVFVDCLTGPVGGPLPPGCEGADFDGDEDVDFVDFFSFQIVFTGSQ